MRRSRSLNIIKTGIYVGNNCGMRVGCSSDIVNQACKAMTNLMQHVIIVSVLLTAFWYAFRPKRN